MKRKLIIPCFILLFSVSCLGGCGDSKAAKEARAAGITQMNEGKYAEAVVSFELALKEADGVVNEFEKDILKYRGEAEYALADYEAAVHTYDILLDVDSEQPEYRYLRAAATALSGDVTAALADYELASATETSMNRNVYGEGICLSAIGRAYTDAGDYDAALKFFQNAENAGKADAGIYNQMGLCMIQANKYDEAVTYFDKGLETGDEKQTKELTYNKAVAYEYKGDFAGAGKLLEEYKASYGTTPELDKELAFLNSRE